jgi:hypothetical protein
MRKLLVAGLLTAMMVSGGRVAGAAERYESQSVNSFWHQRKQVDADTYLRTTWYAGAYQTGEGFWSDLYKNVRRCEKRQGRDRCRRTSFTVGVIRDIGAGSFSVNRGLGEAHLEVTYRLRKFVDGKRVIVGKAHIVANFEGVGDVVRSRDSYSFHSKCDHFSYSGKWRYRSALARGTLDFKDLQGKDLGATRDANIARGQTVEVQHNC